MEGLARDSLSFWRVWIWLHLHARPAMSHRAPYVPSYFMPGEYPFDLHPRQTE